MPEWIAKMLSELTPGGAGVWAIALMLGGWFLQQHRENRKMSIEDRTAIRDGFTKDVTRLAADLDALRGEHRAQAEDLSALRSEYKEYRRECIEESEGLRAEIYRLRGIIESLRSAIGMFRQAAVGKGFEIDPNIAAMLVQLDGPGAAETRADERG